ncbi:hypothetical protein EPR50_G00093250 [Perca flavescens]|uniref:TAFH domain-containing protein n=1 Tax=Perca flavescens TaxID=8167 RepID=A0A484D420_PERFV|nr:hypothetical protein EPR50_G00093250 [Perca flavescens]
MAGASDPLEDMLFNEVDEKAVSDLVGSLESQLGDRKAPAASYSDGKRDAAPTAAGHFSGKVREQVGSVEPQQGHPKAALLTQEPGANVSEPLSGKALTSSTSSVAAGAVIAAGASLQTVGVGASPVISPGTLPTQPGAASFQRTAVLGSSVLAPGSSVLAPGSSVLAPGSSVLAPGSSSAEAIRTASPGLQSLNGGSGAVKLGATTVISTASTGGSTIISPMASQPNNFAPQPTVASPAAGTLQRIPGPVNGLDPKAAPSPAASSSQAGSAAAVTLKPAVNGVGQPAVALVRPPGAVVRPPGAVVTAIQQQRPGLVGGPNRAPAPPQPQIAVRPQQQTIQLPPGFSMPPGMVLVRTETGQLVMVPQQVLAQAQAKTQQAQAQAQAAANLNQRPAAPTAGTAIRVSTAATAPQTVRLAAPVQTRMVQSPSTTVQKALTVAPGGAAVSVKMTPQKAQTVITAGGTPVAKPAGVPSAPLTSTTPPTTPTTPARVNMVSQEMQENVKKCKNFLATLIKLASHNSPSPDTSKNVKALVQDLLDAKIEPEEFTTRLQAELKSSPQPYLIPFLKKSLPTLRQSLLSNQQSLVTPSTSAPHHHHHGHQAPAASQPGRQHG